MTDRTENIIALAEWMYPNIVVGRLQSDGTRLIWETDDNGKCILETIRPIPNPYESADDCEAVVRKLLSLGWHYEERRQPTDDPEMAAGIWLHIWHRDSEIHHRWDGDVDLRGEGVCELALKVAVAE
jgi:hypothetical protein